MGHLDPPLVPLAGVMWEQGGNQGRVPRYACDPTATAQLAGLLIQAVRHALDSIEKSELWQGFMPCHPDPEAVRAVKSAVQDALAALKVTKDNLT